MDIKVLDKNFRQARGNAEEGQKIFKIPCAPFALYGVFYDKEQGCFLRMPYTVGTAVSEGAAWLNRCTAGGRLRFSTDAASLTLKAEWNVFGRMPHMPHSGSSGFVLCDETEHERFVAALIPECNDENGFCRTVALPSGKMRNYILYFPLYNEVTSLTLAFHERDGIAKGKEYKKIAPILYYGSSITQGGCASRADNSYQALIAKHTGVDFINLGFSGNAKGEEAMADYLSSLDCSIFVCDYDHNAPNAEYLAKTHRRFYERYRAVRKDTPILFLSKPDCDRDPDADKRLKVIKNTCRFAKRQGDEHVYLLEGSRLFGSEDRENCTVDGTHPNDLGFYRMAEEIERVLLRIYAKEKKFGDNG